MATLFTAAALPAHHLIKGTPLANVRKVIDQDGLEAYRLLTYPYFLKNIGSKLARLIEALQYEMGPKPYFDELASYQVAIEEKKKTANEAHCDNIRAAVRVQKPPEALKNHVLLTPRNTLDGPPSRKLDYSLARQPMLGDAAPMDVGAVW